MTKHYILKLERNGEIKYCAEITGFPVDMKFIKPSDREEPFWFMTKAEADAYWLLYQRNKPADATGWMAEVIEKEV